MQRRDKKSCLHRVTEVVNDRVKRTHAKGIHRARVAHMALLEAAEVVLEAVPVVATTERPTTIRRLLHKGENRDSTR